MNGKDRSSSLCSHHKLLPTPTLNLTVHASSPPVPHNSNLTPDRYISLPAPLRKPTDLHPLPKHQTMRTPPEMEHAQLLPLLDPLAHRNRDLARAHLSHADAQERHESDGRVVRLDEDERARRRRRDVALAGALALLVRVVRGAEVFELRFRVVRPVDDVAFADHARDGGVPAVVGERAEERLVDRAADELACEGVVREHVGHGVGLAFDPEFGAGGDVGGGVVGQRFAGVGDYVRV